MGEKKENFLGVKGQTQDSTSQKRTKLVINLNDFFDGKIPRDQGFRNAVGQAIIDTILSRTESSKFLPGSTTKGYSKEYKKSLDFNAAGKSNKVNLRLSGDMLDQLDITKISGNKIEIGWSEPDESEKAHGHVTGEGTVPKRDFLGIRPGEARSIKSEFRSALDSFRDKEREEFRERIAALITQFTRDTDGDGET